MKAIARIYFSVSLHYNYTVTLIISISHLVESASLEIIEYSRL